MDVDIDFVSEPVAPADAWASNNTTGHAPEELDLEAMVRQYLANGGKIQEVAQGASAVEIRGAAAFNATFYTTPHVSEELIKARVAHNRTTNAVINHRMYGGDGKLVEKLGKLLDGQPPRKDILSAMGMSDDRLQRLLRMYFNDDPRAAHYKKLTHEKRHELTNPHDAAIAAAIRKCLDAGYTLTQTSKLTGYSASTVRRIVEKYRLVVRVRLKRGMPEEVDHV
ncbi:helix-turn-helix domain-containing protein [Pseudomonas mediterranea]|uniref:helix-turn-helix domain-containing protein n=1 Tax=Pseudomonas mediterranea TaxID=183795 RepID=UPI0006D88F89|nr:helix-turn-helix domain-containing protein [Pseudomonas mediterranea]